MKDVTVARRYARALYQLAVEQKSLEDVLQGMSNVALALQKAPEMKKLLFNPLLKWELKQKLITSVSSNKLILKFTALLAKRKRLDLLPAVHEALVTLDDEAGGVCRALVKTAAPLTDAQKKAVETELAKSMGGKIMGRFEIAKDLIGGVWVQMGDKVLDTTLKGRIETFRTALTHSTN